LAPAPALATFGATAGPMTSSVNLLMPVGFTHAVVSAVARDARGVATTVQALVEILPSHPPTFFANVLPATAEETSTVLLTPLGQDVDCDLDRIVFTVDGVERGRYVAPAGTCGPSGISFTYTMPSFGAAQSVLMALDAVDKLGNTTHLEQLVAVTLDPPPTVNALDVSVTEYEGLGRWISAVAGDTDLRSLAILADGVEIARATSSWDTSSLTASAYYTFPAYTPGRIVTFTAVATDRTGGTGSSMGQTTVLPNPPPVIESLEVPASAAPRSEVLVSVLVSDEACDLDWVELKANGDLVDGYSVDWESCGPTYAYFYFTMPQDGTVAEVVFEATITDLVGRTATRSATTAMSASPPPTFETRGSATATNSSRC